MKTARNSFTLVELLVVMAVIAILSAITLGASGAIQNKAARTRAGAEIAAMSTALESYKTDNGIYPSSTNLTYTTTKPTDAKYPAASSVLFTNLSGKATFGAVTTSGVIYMTFKGSQVYTNATPNYVIDPFGYAYGYSTATASMNVGFFDLWSTSGKTGNTAADTNVWVNNWTAN